MSNLQKATRTELHVGPLGRALNALTAFLVHLVQQCTTRVFGALNDICVSRTQMSVHHGVRTRKGQKGQDVKNYTRTKHGQPED